MPAQSNPAETEPGTQAYRCVGSITIARAASTQREIDALPDPLTLDLSGVEKMDTVGAWLIHRAVRDRWHARANSPREHTRLQGELSADLP